MKKILLAITLLILAIASVEAQWQSVGPYGGIVRCFDTVGATIFAGSDGAGVLKSTNNGSSWSGSSSGLTNLQVYALAHNGSVMVAGTYGGGVFKSTDNGLNWTAINNGITNTAINAVAISGTTIYAGTSATNGGMFISTDGGASWSLSVNGFPTNVYILSITVDGSAVYAGTGDGVFKSTDNGSSWAAINTGLSNLYVNSVHASGTTLYAGTNSGLFKSVNGGGTWSLLHASSLVTSIVINGSSIYTSWGTIGSGGVDMSSNNGGSWTTPHSGKEVWAVALGGGILYAGTNGDGVYSSSNSGVSWTQTSVGINNINTPTILLSTGSDIYAGAFLGGVFKTTNNGGSWAQMNSGLTNIAVQALAANNTHIFAGTNGSGGGVFSSTNNGSSWNLVTNGLTSNNVTSFAVSGTQIFAGTFGDGVFLSANNGGLWTVVSNGLTNMSVQSLLVHGTDLYAGTFYGGIFKSSDNGNNWAASSNGLTNTNVQAFAQFGNKIFAATFGGVFVSADNGANWSPINNGLTSISVMSLAVSDAYIFAGTDGGGVFFSCDTGNTWTAINEGMFNYSVKSLAIADSNVFAATHGGAVFKRPLSEVMRADVTIAQTVGSNPTCENAEVVFTATPYCGGCPASYQWKVNGNNVGTDTSAFTTSSLTNGQVVTCVMTSNLPGIYNSPATSNAITVSVTPAPPTPTISQNGTTLTSSSASGNQWYLDGVIIAGATNQNYTINQNGNYTVITTVGSCSSDTSAVLIINTAFTAGVSIAQTGGTNPTCAGQSVTFTATPVNGGSSPSYLWLLNGSPVGTDSPTYTTTTIASGDIVSCLLTSSMMGVSGNPATSNDLFVTVNTTPSAPTIAQSGATLTSSVSSGNQWYLNGNLIPGATAQIYTATQNGTYTVAVTSNGCTSAASSPVTVSNLVSVGVTIAITSGTNPTCAGSSLTFTATATNGGTNPVYQWQVDGVNTGTNSATYTTSSLTNGQIVTCVVTSNMLGVTNNPATSNAITITISNTPTPTITQSGLVLTSSATTGNQWYLNGNIISGATSQTYTITQNGSYTVISTVNGCASAASAALVDNSSFVAGVTIAVTTGSNPACSGDTLTFTATPVNGGTVPGYQWQLNGANVGTNTAAYSSSALASGDVITCMLISNMPAVAGNPAMSNSITMTVNAAPPVPVITQSGTLLSSSAGSGNQWFLDGSPLPDAFGSAYTAAENGSYTVVVTVNGCSSVSAPFDVVNISVEELFADASVLLYPNPNEGRFTLLSNIDFKEEFDIDIKNALGQHIYSGILNARNGNNKKQIDISSFGKGFYLMTLRGQGKELVKRIVVY